MCVIHLISFINELSIKFMLSEYTGKFTVKYLRLTNKTSLFRMENLLLCCKNILIEFLVFFN